MFKESQSLPTPDRLITADATCPKHPFPIFGYLLVTVGMLVIAFVLTEIYSVYTSYASLSSTSFISALGAKLTDAPLYSKNEVDFVTMGSGTAEIIAFLVFFLLASLGISCGVRVIRCGSYLLSPRFENQIQQIKRSVDGMREEVKQLAASAGLRASHVTPSASEGNGMTKLDL